MLVNGIGIVRKMVDDLFCCRTDTADAFQSFEESFVVFKAHMRACVGDGYVSVGAVQGHKIKLKAFIFEKVEDLIVEKSRIVTVEKGLFALLDNVEKGVFLIHMSCGEAPQCVLAQFKSLEAVYHVEAYVFRSTANLGGSFYAQCRAVYLKGGGFHTVSIGLLSVAELDGV